jgi:1,4-alpha-glucan branching enzyme
MLNKMPGDRWQKFANLRAYYGYLFGHPGKKLLFMGSEFAQEREWNHDFSLDWHLLDDPMHEGMRRLVADLNRLYRATPALYEKDFTYEGFGWVDHSDADRSVVSFARFGRDPDAMIVVVSNFTPTVRHGFRIGVPRPGHYRECLNSDSAHYGGSNVGTPLGTAASQPSGLHGQAQSIVIDLPPLATVFFEWKAA